MELITFRHDAEIFHSRVGVWTFIVARDNSSKRC